MRSSKPLVLFFAFVFLPSLAFSGEIVDDINFGVREHLIPRLVAKEICSCLYNSRLPLEICKKKTGLPRFLSKTPILSFREKDNLIFVKARAVFPSLSRSILYQSTAVFDKQRPDEGCRIVGF